jgi:NADPH-dependent curcumin reductase CurA
LTAENRQLLFAARPQGAVRAGDFALVQAPLPEPGDGEFVVRNHFASLDPAMRQRMTLADNNMPALPLGEPMTATTVGFVTASRNEKFRVGDCVTGRHSIADYSLVQTDSSTRHIDPAATGSLTNHLSILGNTGLSAYFGVLRILKPAEGETVLVSAAAGAVGSVAGQIAKLLGCRVIGIAGGPEKACKLRDHFRFDAGIDYKGLDLGGLTSAIRAAAPDGIDCYFDNVGGVHLDAAIGTLRVRGRVVLCGLISEYDATSPPPRMHNLFKLVLRSARMEGFLLRNFEDEFAAAAAELAGWVRAGKFVFDEDVVDRLEDAPAAFLKLFSGQNKGKLMVRLVPN